MQGGLCYCVEMRKLFGHRGWILLGFGVALAALTVAVWSYGYRQALDALARQGEADLELASDRVSTQLQVYQELAVLMARHPVLGQLEGEENRRLATKLLREVADHLEAEKSRIEMTFPFFLQKKAPVTGVESLMDYEVTLAGEIANGEVLSEVRVAVPVNSLCPCSKEISEYGAHNQRSHVTATIHSNAFIWIEEIIEIIEKEASCELYGILKRPDEKYVTEKAYDNPKFVEDLVRDIAGHFNADERIQAYTVSAENFESIHNHSAYAEITRGDPAT